MGLLALGSAVTAVTATAASMRLRQQVAEIKSELAAKQRKLDAARSEAGRLQAELETARAEPQEDIDQQALREAAESAEERLNQAVAERDAAQEEVRRLQQDGDQLQKVLREAGAWKRRAEEAEDGMRQAAAQMEEVRTEVGALRNEMDETGAAFEELKREREREKQYLHHETENLRQQVKDAEKAAEQARAMTAAQAEAAEQRLSETLAERDASARQALDSADRLQRRLALKNDELRRERSKNRRLDLDLIELLTKLNRESLGPAALHLHAEITELEARLAEAEQSRRDLRERNNRLADQLSKAGEQAAALKAAEERAETAENEALSHLGTIESLELRAAEVDRLEGEIVAISREAAEANRVVTQENGQLRRVQRAHEEEMRVLREQREAARREAQEAKDARDLPEETRAELERKDDEIGRFETKVARLEADLKRKDGEIEGWKSKHGGAQGKADREAKAAKEARDERDDLARRLAGLEQDLENRDAELNELRRGEPSRDGAGERPGGTVLDLGEGSMSEVLRIAAELLDGVEVPDAALEYADEVDKESRERWRESVIEGLHSLNEYATERGGFSGGFYEWQQRGMAKKYPFSTRRIAMKDSDTTASGKTTGAAREFEIDGGVDGGHRKINGAYVIQMESHLTFSGSTPNVPRIYFHDDTGGATGKVHVGFIGPHKLVPTSGGF